ncbi:MAG TPA: helix-turn-helix domain-containing protein [Ideonella sp.]|uniref:helix-turn-helix domain-containing protein n=1 Tax=Ideonella sp. TaxID=1929293 RepID=UPI002C7A534E|nr:helix-turn-helix domain-containing protein [Ideonella sp.]HSI48117.1 helix-turn-helix domain-containing protein [Ideonella sp.]
MAQPFPAPSSSTSPLPPGLYLRQTGDADEQAALLQDWQQDYAQLSAGPFEGRVRELWLGDLHLFVEDTSRRLLQRGALPAGQLALGVPLSLGQGAVSFCGNTDWQGQARAERFCSFSGPAGFEFVTPEGLCMAGFSLPRQSLQALASPAQQLAIERLLTRAGLHAAQPQQLQALREQVTTVLAMAQAQPDLLAWADAASQLREELLSHLLALLPADGGAPAVLSPARAGTLVARAQAWLRQAACASLADEPPSVATLCGALGVSRRTLQSAFQQTTGLAPAAFLRTVRLTAARRALREARSVAEAATSQGFWHLGQFSQDYRELFGELPSATWKRWQQPGGSALH